MGNVTEVEILIGRLFALCAHPYAAWRTHSSRGRLIVLVAYMAAGYATVLSLLLAL